MKVHSKTAREISQLLLSSLDEGLSEKEAKRRLEKNGENKLTEKKKKGLVYKFFMQLNDFMIFILLLSAAVSFFLARYSGQGDYIDSIIILAIVILNAILGLVQESKAEKSLEALKKMTAPRAKVIRDSKIKEIDAKKLVIGDIIILESGNYVPADARIFDSHNLKSQESALTGESDSVLKDDKLLLEADTNISEQKNMVFASSLITYGRSKAIVTSTAMNTELGKIADIIQSHEDGQTPLQKKLDETGKFLAIGALLICFVIFILGIFRNHEIFEMFITSISLAVAAIPEGLPAIVTISLAIGVQKMAQKNAIIRSLPAVETLGGASVICADKTGTITENKMTVIEIHNHEKEVKDLEYRKNILLHASLCNDAYFESNKAFGDPTELAMIEALKSHGEDKAFIDEKYLRVDEIPFDSARKLMSTVHSFKSKYRIITKGASDVLLDKCSHYLDNNEVKPLDNLTRKKIEEENLEMAKRALRVIAVAYKDERLKPNNNTASQLESGLTFLGLIAMIDPPREEVFNAVKLCKKAGIKAVMITGDHLETAKAIAKDVGILTLKDKAIIGQDLKKISQKELEDSIEEYSVFARVSPEDKVRIVKAYQAKGHIVAMTGDGINDAPALKVSDIACAMGKSGTEVAKSASDIILADDNFASIVEAVKEGRNIYKNIRKAVHFLLSSNIGEILTIFVAILFNWPTPLLAIHLLWVNLVTDSLPAIALGLDTSDNSELMNEKPIRHKNFFDDGLAGIILYQGLMIGMLSLLAYGIAWIHFDKLSTPNYARTMSFAVLSISQLVHAFNVREEFSIFDKRNTRNYYLIGAFFIGLFMQVAVIEIKFLSNIFKVENLSVQMWLIVFLLSFAPLLIVETQKYLNKVLSNKKQVKLARRP